MSRPDGAAAGTGTGKKETAEPAKSMTSASTIPARLRVAAGPPAPEALKAAGSARGALADRYGTGPARTDPKAAFSRKAGGGKSPLRSADPKPAFRTC